MTKRVAMSFFIFSLCGIVIQTVYAEDQCQWSVDLMSFKAVHAEANEKLNQIDKQQEPEELSNIVHETHEAFLSLYQSQKVMAMQRADTQRLLLSVLKDHVCFLHQNGVFDNYAVNETCALWKDCMGVYYHAHMKRYMMIIVFLLGGYVLCLIGRVGAHAYRT